MRQRVLIPQPFAVDDMVTCAFQPHALHVIRRVTAVERASSSATGWLVAADGGPQCAACGLNVGSIPPVCASYYTLVPAPAVCEMGDER